MCYVTISFCIIYICKFQIFYLTKKFQIWLFGAIYINCIIGFIYIYTGIGKLIFPLWFVFLCLYTSVNPTFNSKPFKVWLWQIMGHDRLAYSVIVWDLIFQTIIILKSEIFDKVPCNLLRITYSANIGENCVKHKQNIWLSHNQRDVRHRFS